MILSTPIPKKNYIIANKTFIKTINKIFLPKFESKQIDFFDVVNKRISNRNIQRNLSVLDISPILWYTFKIRNTIHDQDKIIWQQQYIPTSGGLGCIHVMLFNLDELTDKVYIYNGLDHSVNEIIFDKEDYKQIILNQAHKLFEFSKKGTLLLYFADTQQLDSKYLNYESLAWRDVGVIYNNIYLLSAALNIKTCAIGYTFNTEFQLCFNNNTLYAVGAQVVGK